MQKRFIEYTEAEELQRLGFDEICFGYYRSVLGKPDIELIIRQTPPRFYHLVTIPEHFDVLAPTYSQAFEFFEEKFKLFPTLHVDRTMEPKFGYSIAEFFEDEGGFFDWKNIMSSYLYYTRQESKLECLRELIKIVKEKTNGKQ